MIYIISANKEVSFAEWYDYGTHYEEGAVFIDTNDNTITYDGVNWVKINEFEF